MSFPFRYLLRIKYTVFIGAVRIRVSYYSLLSVNSRIISLPTGAVTTDYMKLGIRYFSVMSKSQKNTIYSHFQSQFWRNGVDKTEGLKIKNIFKFIYMVTKLKIYLQAEYKKNIHILLITLLL